MVQCQLKAENGIGLNFSWDYLGEESFSTAAIPIYWYYYWHFKGIKDFSIGNGKSLRNYHKRILRSWHDNP